MSDERYQLWGGCFEEEPSTVLRRINDSLNIDARLYRQDIRGSKAWAAELYESGYLSKDDNDSIQKGLDRVESDIEKDLANGRLNDPEEDIHSVVERRLKEYAGESALRLHTGRSRNDQSATNTKLWMLASITGAQSELLRLILVLTKRAQDEINIITPGYTHLQRAQPIRWSHFLLSYAWMFRDDFLRLEEQKKRLSICPLGSGAIAGCALAINRTRLAKNLGFDGVTPNSMFAVGSRDHIVEFLNWISLCGTHLSRLAEDLIIFSSREFGIIEHSDQFSTGSSLMPQKRNPDGLELVRGAAGLFLGDAFSLSCILKGLPSTYNKDLQSDKEILFRSYDRLIVCLKVTFGTVNTMTIDAARASSLLDTEMLATDLAHALVHKGVPFRQAHHLVGSLLRRAAMLGVNLQELPYQEYISICPKFGTEDELRNIFSFETSVEQYKSEGGTSKDAVLLQIRKMQQWAEPYEALCEIRK